MESNDEPTTEQLILDYRKADLGEADRAMCDFAVKLTIALDKIGQQDIDQLRKYQLSDEQVTVAAQVIGYFNYINRVALGLGVEPESWMKPEESVWRAEKANWR